MNARDALDRMNAGGGIGAAGITRQTVKDMANPDMTRAANLKKPRPSII